MNIKLNGSLIKILPASTEISDVDLVRFYKCRPQDSNYEVCKRAVNYARLIMRRINPTCPAQESDDDPSYYIIPNHPFYTEVLP